MNLGNPWRGMAFAVLTALAAAAPLAACTGSTKGGQPPPTVPATSEVPKPTGTKAPADGRLTQGQLLAAPVDLPAWPSEASFCPAGRVTLRQPGGTNDSVRAELARVVHANLDGDDAAETAAQIECQQNTGSYAAYTLIVAFDRGADGAVVTLGTVAAVEKGVLIKELAARPAGVRLELEKIAGLGNEWPSQVREFAWDGKAFVQVSGPRSFS